MIEKASSKDAKDILAYLKQIGGESNNLTFGEEGLPITVEQETAYIKQIENSTDSIMLLAKIEEKIVGNASLNRFSRRMSHRGELGVSVLKEYWNKGIGSRLIDELLAFAKIHNIEIIDLQVRSDNLSAIHLYEKYGFIKIGTHPSFFKINNEDISFDYLILKIK